MTKRKHRGGSSDRSTSRSDRSGPSTSSFSDRPSYGKGGPKPHVAGGKLARRPTFGGGEGASREDRPAFGKRPGKVPFRPGKPGKKFARDGAARNEGRPRFPKDVRKVQPERSSPRQAPAAEALPAIRVETRAAAGAPRPPRVPRNQIWLYGLHAVMAALANPRRRRHRLLLSAEASATLREDPRAINHLEAGPVEVMGREDIARVLPPGAVHQGAALLTEPLPDTALEDVLDEAGQAESSIILVLDQVTDPQNVGAILRSAAAFGAAAVVVPVRHAPPETAALVKAASGAVEIVPLVRVINLARALEDLKKAGYWIAGLDGQAPRTLAAADMSGKVVLVLGAEGEGLRRLTRDHCDILVRLPISERMESLNVSAAAAVALYELARKA